MKNNIEIREYSQRCGKTLEQAKNISKAVRRLRKDKSLFLQGPIFHVQNPQNPFAEDYIRRTDMYDQRICSRNNEGIPVTNEERSLINRHAIKVRDILLKQMKRMGIDTAGFNKTIQALNRLQHNNTIQY